jgi:hypothetical protein
VAGNYLQRANHRTIRNTEMSKPDDRSTNSVSTENSRPRGGEQTPTNLKTVPDKPASTPEQFGGYGRK